MRALIFPSSPSFLHVAALLLAFGLDTGSAAAAQQLWVSNRGVDSATCGATTDAACRSISRAIANANAGDTILVGPGKYGDLNSDGDRDDPGEELSAESPDIALVVNKRVRIFSTRGAYATVIDVSAPVVVLINADGVVFGERGQGFTLHGAGGGLSVDFLASNVSVTGNVLVGGGFSVEPSEGPVYLSYNIASESPAYGFLIGRDVDNDGSGYAVVRGNTAVGSRLAGFLVQGYSGHRIIDNTAISNGISYTGTGSGAGFQVEGSGHSVQGNLSTGNGHGFIVNSYSGAGGNQTFLRNSAIGNEVSGFNVGFGITNIVIRENNIYGNLGTARFCGVVNTGADPVDARNNYWGRSGGPTGCPSDGGPLVLTPFATVPFAINPTKLGP